MKSSIHLLLATLALALIGTLPATRGAETAATSPFRFDLRAPTGPLELQYSGKRILLYCFAPTQFKPYVKELWTLDGSNLLLDSPPDHVHHHGLMYAIKVNGTNFWEETTNAGWQIPVGPPSCSTTPSNASFSQTLYWVLGTEARHPKPSDPALLIEQRTITVAVDASAKDLELSWKSRFEVGPGLASVTLGGTHYHGLGLRLPKSFDLVGRRSNSAGLPYKPEGTDEVTPAWWTAMTGETEAGPVTVALFNDPANRAESKMFSMLKGFAYLSATQGLDKAPLIYHSGETFELSYLLVVHPGLLSPAALEQRGQSRFARTR